MQHTALQFHVSLLTRLYTFLSVRSVGNPLIDGIFLDDEWSVTGGAAENCDLADCQHDMGLTTKVRRRD